MADRTVRVKLTADVDAYIRDVAAATAATKELRQAAQKFDDRYTATMKVNDRTAGGLRSAERRVGQSVGRIRGQMRSLHRLKIPAIAVGGISGAGDIASLIGSAQKLIGVLGLVPAAVMGAGAAIGTIVAGMEGFGDAVSEGGDALAALTPNARAAAEELRSQADAWREVQKATQEALFEGQAEKLDEFGRVLIPVLSEAAGGLATELGDAASAFMDFAVQADSVRDTKEGLELTRQAAEQLAPALVNVSAWFRDLAAVGARHLPELARGIENVTDRWRIAIADARASGELQQWMQEGIAEAQQLGRIVGDLGGILAGLGRASEAAGINTVDSLERMTSSAHAFIDSWQGQAQIRAFFASIRADALAFLPGLKDLAGAAFDFINTLSGSGTIRMAGEAFSALVAAARPTMEVLGQLTSAVLRPMLGLIKGIAPALGPAIAGFVAFKGAAAVLGRLQGGLAVVGGRFDKAARAASGNATAVSRVSRVTGGLARALPGVGLAIVAAAGTYELLRDRSKEAAAAVLNGSLSIQEAINKETAALHRQDMVKTAMKESQPGYVQGMAIAGIQHDKNAESAKREATATSMVFAEMRKRIQQAPPLEAASMRVTLAQQKLNLAIDRYGQTSPQAATAANGLRFATEQLEIKQLAARLAVDEHTAAIIRNRNQMLAAEDAEIAYEAAIDQATLSVQQNGATLDINTEKGRANKRALQEISRAAFADIDAKKQHGASIDDIARRTDNHRQELVDAAIQMGMSRDEANAYADSLGLIPKDVNTNFTTSGIDSALSRVGQLAVEIDGVYIPEGALPGPGERPGERTQGITGYATGGTIRGPGTGTSDDVLMWGSNGEFMMRKRAVDQQGTGAMAALNAGQADIVPRYARGGEVGGFVNMTKERENGIPRWVNLDFAPMASRIQADMDRIKDYKAQMVASVGGGSGRWAPVALQALGMLGLPASLLPRVLQQIQIESGGNPRAINLWDINARRGTPSMGLIQTIMPTYQANADPRRNLGPYDPLSNLLAGMRYAVRRYGSIANIWPKTWGYHDGGVIPGSGGGDNKLIRAQSGERVLTTGQNLAFERLVEAIDRPTPVSPLLAAGVRGGDGASTQVEINNENHFTEAVDLDLFNQRQDFAVRATRL